MTKIIENKYLLKAGSSFLIENFIKKMRLDLSGYNLILCGDAEEFIQKASEQSLFNDNNRILVLNDIDPDFVDSLGAIIHQSTTDVWVLIQRQTISRTKAYTVIKGACKLVELKELDEAQCAVWVRQWLTEMKLIFPEEIPSVIVSKIGPDILKLHNEMKKIAAYYRDSGDKVLTQVLCNQFFVDNADAKMYDLIEHILKKRIKEVFEELGKIDEYSYVKLLHLMIGQVEKVYKVAVYKEQNMSAEDIGSILGIPRFIVSMKLIPVLSFYGKIKLMQVMDILNKLDSELRLTKFPKSLIMESYLLKVMKL